MPVAVLHTLGTAYSHYSAGSNLQLQAKIARYCAVTGFRLACGAEISAADVADDAWEGALDWYMPWRWAGFKTAGEAWDWAFTAEEEAAKSTVRGPCIAYPVGHRVVPVYPRVVTH